MIDGMGFKTLIWTHEERPCRCSVEHRPHCHRCGGSGIYKSARLRRIDATTTHQAATGDSATGAVYDSEDDALNTWRKSENLPPDYEPKWINVTTLGMGHNRYVLHTPPVNPH